MKVNEIARKAGASTDAVRYYSRIGLLRPARNPENGYKRFADGDLLRLRFIRQARELGFTLGEIAEILDHAREGESPCPRVRQIIEQRIEETRARVAELVDLQRRMERALARWNEMPDGIPDEQTVCHLIESVEDLPSE